MTFAYNVFLSHNSKDKPAVEAITRLLQREDQLHAGWIKDRMKVRSRVDRSSNTY